ncbi:amidohydrolase [Acetobacterium bakii]|uniref:Amidohydrolase n=1 Tax=Acetobacterium bakii TaxID=52689 RepID=A0A0L6TZS0_9FIRM|nr:amidohydrolase [Acetobacterium bakii]
MELLNTYLDEAIRIRQELHQIPEEGLNLPKTKKYIINYLENLGYQPEMICNAGINLHIQGEDKDNSIAFRADMDALCVTEETEHGFASIYPGWMHACGHDGHMTMNLLLAKYLADHPEEKKRSVLLIFQAGEEGPGGAEPIVKTGILKKYDVKAIFGYHLFPFIKEGMLSTTSGPMMGQNSGFYFTVHGKSGHAAQPQRSVDAIVASASLITGIQSIVSRNVNPMKSVVIAIGLLNGGTRINVVAEEVKIGGTMRSFSEETHLMLQNRMGEVAKGVELIHGCTIDLEFVDMYPSVINDASLYDIYLKLCEPKDRVVFRKVMLAEDFSYYQKEIPGLFIGIGTGNASKGFDENLHSSRFDFDEKVLIKGLEMSLKFINYKKKY